MKAKGKSLFTADAVSAPPATPPTADNPFPADTPPTIAERERWAAWVTTETESDLEILLKQMESLADHAIADDRIERGSEYAKRIRKKARRVRLHVAEGNANQAALEGIRLAEIWMQLRVDTMFAGPVWEKANRRESASDHSDADILAAVAAHKKKIDAAVALGIDPSTLRKRLAAIKKRES